MAKNIQYSIIDSEGIKVLKLVGHISSSNRYEFEALIKKLSERNHLIINMQDVDVITSSGFDSLISVVQHARRGKWKLMLMGVRESLKRYMENMEIRHNFILIDSIEEGQTRINYY